MRGWDQALGCHAAALQSHTREFAGENTAACADFLLPQCQECQERGSGVSPSKESMVCVEAAAQPGLHNGGVPLMLQGRSSRHLQHTQVVALDVAHRKLQVQCGMLEVGSLFRQMERPDRHSQGAMHCLPSPDRDAPPLYQLSACTRSLGTTLHQNNLIHPKVSISDLRLTISLASMRVPTILSRTSDAAAILCSPSGVA